MSDSFIARFPDRPLLSPELFKRTEIGFRSTKRGLLFGITGFKVPVQAVDWEGEGATLDFQRSDGPLYCSVGPNSYVAGALLEDVLFRVDPASAYFYRATRSIVGSLLVGPSGARHVVAWNGERRDRDALDVRISGAALNSEGTIGYRSWAVGTIFEERFVPIMEVTVSED